MPRCVLVAEHGAYRASTEPAQLAECCPRTGNGRVIVTSRDRAVAQFGPALIVDVFDLDTAERYLIARSGRDDAPGARRLARAVDCLPLALALPARTARPVRASITPHDDRRGRYSRRRACAIGSFGGD